MLKGKGISDGIGLGKVVVLKNEEIKPEKIRIEDVEAEKEVFYQAIHAVEEETSSFIRKNIWNGKRYYASLFNDITRPYTHTRNHQNHGTRKV